MFNGFVSKLMLLIGGLNIFMYVLTQNSINAVVGLFIVLAEIWKVLVDIHDSIDAKKEKKSQ